MAIVGKSQGLKDPLDVYDFDNSSDISNFTSVTMRLPQKFGKGKGAPALKQAQKCMINPAVKCKQFVEKHFQYNGEPVVPYEASLPEFSEENRLPDSSTVTEKSETFTELFSVPNPLQPAQTTSKFCTSTPIRVPQETKCVQQKPRNQNVNFSEKNKLTNLVINNSVSDEKKLPNSPSNSGGGKKLTKSAITKKRDNSVINSSNNSKKLKNPTTGDLKGPKLNGTMPKLVQEVLNGSKDNLDSAPRRSQRSRMSPVRYWVGERVIYNLEGRSLIKKSTKSSFENIQYVSPEESKRNRNSNSKRKSDGPHLEAETVKRRRGPKSKPEEPVSPKKKKSTKAEKAENGAHIVHLLNCLIEKNKSGMRKKCGNKGSKSMAEKSLAHKITNKNKENDLGFRRHTMHVPVGATKRKLYRADEPVGSILL